MSSKCRDRGWGLILMVFLPLLIPIQGRAQVIPVKSVPVASGDQFLLFPSQNLAMGGLSLALPDTLGDPFVNPAAGSRIRESFFFGAPTYFSISNRNGSGTTLPMGMLFRAGEWFGGGAVSLQELEASRRRNQWRPWFSQWAPPPQLLSEGSNRNLYAFGTVGRRLSGSRISIGLSGFWADLNAVDGVDLLYANSTDIQQSGSFSDLRLGVMKEWEGRRSLELLLFRSRLRMAHDVSYLDWAWNQGSPDANPVAEWVPRLEKNLDHTDTWGAHLAFRRPLSAPGWTVAWSLTGNWKDHPKIPNYEIQNIPRDPGNTQAYALSLGFSKVEGDLRFGAELSFEPIQSETWADLAQDTVSATGSVISAGEKTVENEFQFTNALVAVGGSWTHRGFTVKSGVRIRSISYELDQYDRIQRSKRDQTESWMEWTPSIGIDASVRGVHLEYAFLLTTGTGRPGVDSNPIWSVGVPTFDSAADVILAPSGPVTLQDATVTTHRLSVVIPIR